MAGVVFLVPDLGGGALYTAYQFAGALGGRPRVRMVGPAAEVWLPLRELVEPDGVLPGANPLTSGVRRALVSQLRGAAFIYSFKALPQSFGLALWARCRLGIPVALHLDDWDGGWFAGVSVARRLWYMLRSVGRPNNELYVRAMEALVPRADVVTVSSRALQRRFGGVLVRQGVDTAAVSPARFPRAVARERLGVCAAMRVVLFLGTPQAHKGLDDLVAAYGRLDRGGVRLWIVGAAPGVRLGGPGIELRPAVSFREACWYMAAADVFVVPQRSTPYAEHQLPAKLLQAMALGVPIVATAVGDVPELLGGEPPAGVVVPAGDVAALAEAVAGLIGDEERARALGVEARRRAEREHGWLAMAQRLRDALAPLGLDG